MSSPNQNLTPSTSRKKRQYSMERVMLGLIGVFVLGTLAYTFLSEPWRGISMALISASTFLVMFL